MRARLLFWMYRKGFKRGFEAGLRSVERDYNYGLRKDLK